MAFRPATKQKSRLRMALDGVAGSGKTLTALRAALAICRPGGKIAVINTESGAIEKYLGDVWDGSPLAFDIDELPDFSPTSYTSKISEAGQLGYDVLIIDSLSHAWAGSGGALEIVDKGAGKSAFTSKDGWRKVTPMHNQMIEAILRSPCHIIVTMRTKTEYVLEEQVNPQTGAKQQVPKKIGMKPVQREGMEYEFDVVGDMDETHTLSISKTRCSALDNALCVKPGADFFRTLKIWLEDGSDPAKGYYTANLGDLQATKDMNAERTAEQQQVQAAAQRRAELQTMAGQMIVTTTTAPTGAVTGSAGTTEQPPFEPTSTQPQPQASTNGAAPARATTEQLMELVQVGALIGRTPQMIADECRQKLGMRPDELPLETFNRLLAAFKQIEQQARTAKNQSAA